jgi:Cu/Zn superoxide dismutase
VTPPSEAPDGVKVALSLENVSPGEQGAHFYEKKDDGGQPTGNAGGRIGCGEIK